MRVYLQKSLKVDKNISLNKDDEGFIRCIQINVKGSDVYLIDFKTHKMVPVESRLVEFRPSR